MEILEVLEVVTLIPDLPSSNEKKPFSKDGLIVSCSILVFLFCLICFIQSFDDFKLIENYREILFYAIIGSFVLSILTIYILHKIKILMDIKMETFLFLLIAMTFCFINLYVYLELN